MYQVVTRYGHVLRVEPPLLAHDPRGRHLAGAGHSAVLVADRRKPERLELDGRERGPDPAPK